MVRQKRLSVFLSILLVLLAFQAYSLRVNPKQGSLFTVFLVYAQDDNGTPTNQTVPIVHENEFLVDRTVFKPATVQVNFPYTHSSNVSDISTVGSSVYKYQITPTSVSFVAEDIDVYTFSIDVGYDNATRREIDVGIVQGDLPMEGYSWYESGVNYRIDFRLTMTNEPSYPTDAEVAQQVVQQLEKTFQQQLEANQNILNAVQATSYTTSIVSVIAGVISIIALLLAGFGGLRRRKEPIEEPGG